MKKSLLDLGKFYSHLETESLRKDVQQYQQGFISFIWPTLKALGLKHDPLGTDENKIIFSLKLYPVYLDFKKSMNEMYGGNEPSYAEFAQFVRIFQAALLPELPKGFGTRSNSDSHFDHYYDVYRSARAFERSGRASSARNIIKGVEHHLDEKLLPDIFVHKLSKFRVALSSGNTAALTIAGELARIIDISQQRNREVRYFAEEAYVGLLSFSDPISPITRNVIGRSKTTAQGLFQINRGNLHRWIRHGSLLLAQGCGDNEHISPFNALAWYEIDVPPYLVTQPNFASWDHLDDTDSKPLPRSYADEHSSNRGSIRLKYR